MKNHTTLNVKDLALLKTNPIAYYKKTHDGTSMGGLRSIIYDFNQKYALERQKHIISYDSQGNEVNHVQRPVKYEGLPDPVPIPRNIWDNYSNLDMVSNLGGTDEILIGSSEVYPIDVGMSYKNNQSSFNRYEYGSLIQKNKEGEYTYRSITMVSPDGTSMTLIKNNKFNEADEDIYYDLAMKFDREMAGYTLQCKKDYNNKYEELIKEGAEPIQAKREARKYTRDKNGDMHDFIKEQGWDKTFEEQCNTKLRLRNSEINTAKPPEKQNHPLDLDFIDLFNNATNDDYPDGAYIDDEGKIRVADLGDDKFISDSGYIEDLYGNRYGKYE